MAWTHGLASSHVDIFNHLIDFVTDPSPMGSDVWSVARRTEDEAILMGTGGGSDRIFVGIKAVTNDANSWYFWFLNSFVEYDDQQDFISQPGATRSDKWGWNVLTWKNVWKAGATTSVPDLYYPTLDSWPIMDNYTDVLPNRNLIGTPIIPFLKNEGMEYWIIADSYCIILVAKWAGHYETCYLGFFNPLAQNGQYGCPLVVGGSATGVTDIGTTYKVSPYSSTWTPLLVRKFNPSWMADKSDHRHFINPGTTWPIEYSKKSSCMFRRPDGQWKSILNKRQIVNVIYTAATNTYSFASNQETLEPVGNNIWPTLCDTSKCYKSMSGDVLLIPAYLMEDTNIVGSFRKVFWASGKGVSEDSILDLGGKQYLVIRNADWIRYDHQGATGFIPESSQNEYWAVLLE